MNFRIGWDGGMEAGGMRAIDRNHQARPQPLSVTEPLPRAGKLPLQRVKHFAERGSRHQKRRNVHPQLAEFGVGVDPRHDWDRKAAPGGGVNPPSPVPDH